MYTIVLIYLCYQCMICVESRLELRKLNSQCAARNNFLEKIYDILKYKNKINLNISAFRGVLLNILYNTF